MEVPSHRKLITRHLGTRRDAYLYLKLILELSQDAVLCLALLSHAPMKLPEESCQVQVLIGLEPGGRHGGLPAEDLEVVAPGVAVSATRESTSLSPMAEPVISTSGESDVRGEAGCAADLVVPPSIQRGEVTTVSSTTGEGVGAA